MVQLDTSQMCKGLYIQVIVINWPISIVCRSLLFIMESVILNSPSTYSYMHQIITCYGVYFLLRSFILQVRQVRSKTQHIPTAQEMCELLS